MKFFGLIRKAINNLSPGVGHLTPISARFAVLKNIGFNAAIIIDAPDEVGDGYEYEFYLQDDGTSRTITWNAAFDSKIFTLPTASIAGKLMYLKVVYSTDTSKWELIEFRYDGSIQVPLGFTPENSANKETSALDSSTTKYPCNNIVKVETDGIKIRNEGYSTTETAAGNTTLTVNSNKNQYFTGSNIQTVVMPATNTLTLGRQYIIRNLSTYAGLSLTIQAGDTSEIVKTGICETVILTCIDTSGNTNAAWDITRENAAIEYISIPCSDYTTALTAGTNKVPGLFYNFNFKLLAVYASLTTVCTGSTFIFDINNGANSFLTDKLSIDASENTSGTAASAATINSTYANYTANTALTIDFDQVGATIAGAGACILLKVKHT